jgi:transposase
VPSAAPRGEAPLRVDLPLRGRGAHEWRELLLVHAGHGRGRCLEAFLEHLGEAYSAYHLILVVDNAPSHLSQGIVHPENVSLLNLPAYSPELNPVERWFLEFRRALSNKVFESVELLQEALTKALVPYWRTPALLQRLTGYSWWVDAIDTLVHQ